MPPQFNFDRMKFKFVFSTPPDAKNLNTTHIKWINRGPVRAQRKHVRAIDSKVCVGGKQKDDQKTEKRCWFQQLCFFFFYVCVDHALVCVRVSARCVNSWHLKGTGTRTTRLASFSEIKYEKRTFPVELFELMIYSLQAGPSCQVVEICFSITSSISKFSIVPRTWY